MAQPGEANPAAETPWTWANLVTTIRVVACVIMFAYAFVHGDPTWNFVGLGTYWVLDVADGFLARRFNQETRLGAQYDILADRLLVCLFYFNYLVLHPDMLVPIFLFLFQFMGIDHLLSNQFMRWPILSPNYFARVEPRIYALNWSPAAKALNSAVVTIVLVGTGSAVLGSIVALLIIGLKLYSFAVLVRMPSPEVAWPALAPPPPGPGTPA